MLRNALPELLRGYREMLRARAVLAERIEVATKAATMATSCGDRLHYEDRCELYRDIERQIREE